MKRRGQRADAARGSGARPCRVDRKTKALPARLEPGDIAIIDHTDIDRASAEALVACRPYVILNAARSSSGRYPNVGPSVIIDAGILLVDDLGPDVMALAEGTRVSIEGSQVVRANGEVVARGERQSPATVESALARAKRGLAVHLESVCANSIEYMRREQALVVDGEGMPRLRTQISGRAVVVVIPGCRSGEELALLRRFIRDYRPVLIGVDAGADVLLEADFTPDLIVGNVNSVSETALAAGAEIVVPTGADGRGAGLTRLDEKGLAHVPLAATGAPEDLAILLAHHAKADLIVTAGADATLLEALDRDRPGMASGLIARLAAGSRLVSARSVATLHRPAVSGWVVFLFLLAGILAFALALATTPAGMSLYHVIGERVAPLMDWVRGLAGLGSSIS